MFLMNNAMHCSDELLLKSLDGALSASEAVKLDQHLADCWTCRARCLELESAITGFVRLHQSQPLPPLEGARALLRARLSQASTEPSFAGHFSSWQTWATAAAIMAVLVGGALLEWRGFATRNTELAVVVPNPSLTPGAAILTDERQVCRESNTKNREVPSALRRRVFEEYGIVRAEPRAYEVDYLITPALGGADDIHNLWPQSSRSTPWNAGVKDALEDHLRELVCQGKVDLATAQQEIAGNWIGAYKKYFTTEQPLPSSQPQ